MRIIIEIIIIVALIAWIIDAQIKIGRLRAALAKAYVEQMQTYNMLNATIDNLNQTMSGFLDGDFVQNDQRSE